MICLETHCSICNHICVRSPFFHKITKAERMNILLNDYKIIPKKDYLSYQCSNKEMGEILNELKKIEEI